MPHFGLSSHMLNSEEYCPLFTEQFSWKTFLISLIRKNVNWFWNLLNDIRLISIELFIDFSTSDYRWLCPFEPSTEMPLAVIVLLNQPTFLYFLDFLYFSLAWIYSILSPINLYKMRFILCILLFERHRFPTMHHIWWHQVVFQRIHLILHLRNLIIIYKLKLKCLTYSFLLYLGNWLFFI